MARKTTTFQIEGYDKQFEVRELTVKQIMELMQKDAEDTSLLGLIGQIKDFLPIATNITMDEIYVMPPSDIQVIWDKFKEVNKTFFGVSQQAGLGDLLGEMKRAIITDFGKLLVSSSKQGIMESLNTDTPSSSMP